MKLTPTTNDMLQAQRGPGRPRKHGNGLHTVAAHEPLPSEVYTLVTPPPPEVQQFLQTVADTPVQEQTKNVSPIVAPKPLKIALVGTAPSSRMLAPFSDPSWTIWVCSPGNMGVVPRVDAWFEIHGSMLWPENKHYGEPYLKWLKEQKFPIYMQDTSFVPNALPLPIDALVGEFGPYFFSSSFAWMMGFAMLQGAQEIALFGIDMASRDEYILQRPGAYYFFREAQKRGVKVSAPYESDIMQPPTLYGFSEVTPLGRKIIARKTELKERVTQMRQQRDGLEKSITYLEGALEDCDYFETIWGAAQSHVYTIVKPGQG